MATLIYGVGDDGRDFITVEHCGDDFLASLAETMQDSEDWDDIQELENEACGTLADMFSQDSMKHNETDDDDGFKEPYVHVLDDSPEVKKHKNFIQLSEDDDLDFDISNKKDIKSTYSSSRSKISHLDESTSKTKVKDCICISNTSTILTSEKF